MKHNRRILTAVILSGSVGLGAQSLPAQDVPKGRPSEPTMPQPKQNIPEKIQPPAGEGERRGGEGLQPGTSSASSQQIRSAKEALKARGHDPGPINGTMDSNTQKALREFQQANNLRVTGVLDQQTAEKLGLTVGGQGSIEERGQPGSPRQPPAKDAIK